MKKIILIQVIIAALFVVSGYSFMGISGSQVSSIYFEPPEQIIVHKKGMQIYIEKETELYNKIIKMVATRFIGKIGITETSIDHEIEIKKNELSLEFTYNRQVSTEYKLKDKVVTKKYTKLLIPLTGWSNDVIFFGDDEGYKSGPIGIFSKPNNLIKLVINDIK